MARLLIGAAQVSRADPGSALQWGPCILIVVIWPVLHRR